MASERVVIIGSDHPSLAGHFPGHPVVPGVVILNEVVESIRQAHPRGLVLTGLPSAKLSSPLKPGETLTIRVEGGEAGRATFTCHVESRLVASGTVEFQSDTEGRADRR